MALVDDAIYSRATTHAGLSALISTRAYPVKLPQRATLPALAYQKTGRERYHAGGSDGDAVSSRYQLTGFAATHKGAQLLAAAVIDAFSRFRGTVADVVITDTFADNEVDAYEDETGQFMVPIDITIHHEAV